MTGPLSLSFLVKLRMVFRTRIEETKIVPTAGIELFHCPVDKLSNHYTYTKEEYLEKLRISKFDCVLLVMVRSAIERLNFLEWEKILFAPEVDNTYHEPMVEGLHFPGKFTRGCEANYRVNQ